MRISAAGDRADLVAEADEPLPTSVRVLGAGAIFAITPASTKNVHSVAITGW